MALVTVALGANLGEPLATLRKVVSEIEASPDFSEVKVSPFYDTSPVESSGPDYVNAVLTAKTDLAPKEVLHRLQKLEIRYGRVRPAGVVNAPRTLDLDVLLYDDLQSDDPELILPHPRMTGRLFVLVPLADLAGEDSLLEGRTLAEWIATVRRKDPSQSIAFLARS
ncbi:MAG TPA: 2-amino-4-hydroxy-6-hydroxymethyldihydropteridine diphosphokinase [Candidatus Sutterella merdavium]|nr:2-amino-4-hydroxy-6-hydroxymethyldihydropteridine diphosphokinase [Candidatus Sutterella merdavium]